MNITRVLRQDVAPVASAFLVFLVLFVWYGTRRAGSSPRQSSVERATGLGWLAFLRRLLLTLAGAYIVFVLIITIFYLVLGGQPRNFVPQSLTQGAVLSFGIVLPAFLLLTWAEAALYRGHPRRSGAAGR